jgi:hypothetical protein
VARVDHGSPIARRPHDVVVQTMPHASSLGSVSATTITV